MEMIRYFVPVAVLLLSGCAAAPEQKASASDDKWTYEEALEFHQAVSDKEGYRDWLNSFVEYQNRVLHPKTKHCYGVSEDEVSVILVIGQLPRMTNAGIALFVPDIEGKKSDCFAKVYTAAGVPAVPYTPTSIKVVFGNP